jgi:hypothetical protein
MEVRVEFSSGIPPRSAGPFDPAAAGLKRHYVPKRSRTFPCFSAGEEILAARQEGKLRFSMAIYP